jgi:hypothetical protein
MATENVTVNAKLNADTTKATGNIDKTTKSIESYRQAAVRANKATKAAAQFSNTASRNFSKQSAEYSKVIQLYASTAATLFTVTSAFRALKVAADTEVMETSMKTLTAITGYSVASMVKDLKELSDGAISTADAMRAANLSATAGIDPETFTRIGKAAKGAAKALGRDYGDALDRITKGIIKAEPELLDELGIIVRLDTVYQEYAKTLGITSIELTEFQKSQARTNAVLGQAEAKYGDLASQQATDIQKIGAVAADMVKELTGIGVSVASVLAPVIATVPGMVGTFALIGTIIAKNWVPSMDQFVSKSADLSRRNDIVRAGYVKQSALLTEQELKSKNLNLAGKIHLTLQRAELATKKKLLVLEREHIIAATERNAVGILSSVELSTLEKIKGVYAQIGAGLKQMSADYKASKIGLEGMNTSTKALLASQYAYNRALLVGKVLLQSTMAIFSKALGWIGALTVAYSLLSTVYEKFFVTDEDRAREKNIENITTLLADQKKLLEQQKSEVDAINGSYESMVNFITKSVRGASELGALMLEVRGYNMDIQQIGQTRNGMAINRVKFDKDGLEERKESITQLVAFLGTIDSSLSKKVSDLFNIDTGTFKQGGGGSAELDGILKFLDQYEFSIKSLGASSKKAAADAKEFTNIVPEKSIFSEGASAIGTYISGLQQASKELASTKEGTPEYDLLSRAIQKNSKETLEYLNSIGLYSGSVFEGFQDNVLALGDLRAELTKAHKESIAFNKDLAAAKLGTSEQIVTRGSLKKSADIVSDGQSGLTSSSGASPELLEAEYAIKMKLQSLNQKQLASAREVALNYARTLNNLANETTAQGKKRQYLEAHAEVMAKVGQIEKEQADALDTQISKQEALLAVEKARLNQTKKFLTDMGQALGGTGNVWASTHQAVFTLTTGIMDANLAQKTYEATVTGSKDRIAELDTVIASTASSTERNNAVTERSALVAQSDAAAQEARMTAMAAVGSGVAALGQMVAASYSMQADAIGYQIQMEQARDGESAESQAKIQKLQEKQIKEDAKAKKAQIVMATSLAVMQAFAQGGPYLGPVFAAIALAMGAQQLSAVDSATSGQLGVLSASSTTDENSYSVSNSGTVDLTSAAAAGEIESYRATGGGVSAGTSVVLGEKGAEKVTFNEDVMIQSNADATNASSSDRQPIQLNISAVDAVDVQRLFANNGSALIDSLEQEANSRGITITGGV